MKATLLSSLGIIACYNFYANCGPLSTPSTTPILSSTSDNHDPLKPITFEVAANGIVEPGHADGNSRTIGHPGHSHPDNLENFPVITTEQEAAQPPSTQDTQMADTSPGFDYLSKKHHHHHKHDPFRAGGLRLGHGPVVQGARPIITADRLLATPSTAYSQPGHNKPSPKYLVISLTENGKNSNPNILTSETVQPTNDIPSTDSKSEQCTSKPASSKSPSINTSSGGFATGVLPTIPRCLSILRPLRDLAEQLVYIKEAPHHTLMSACHFQSLNRTHYDGRHVERMRELCWDLFETIQLEGRRRWERCNSKAEDKYQYNSSAWQEGDPIYEQASGVDKFSFHTYQLTPGKVQEFIAEHPDLSPEDIEWLTHDTNPTDTTASIPSNKRSVSNLSKRSWLSNLFKSVFSAEVDTSIKQLGKGMGGVVTGEAHEYRQKAHSENGTSNTHHNPPHHSSTGVAHAKKDAQSNRIYVHGEWYPIGPVNKYVNQPRGNVGLPFSSEDIDNYLEFVRETRHLNAKQYRRLKVAVERELKLNSHLLSTIESKYNSQSEDLLDKQKRHMDHQVIHKRSGQPPRLNSNFRYPYQWNYPSDLASNPAYINLTLAWNNTVTTEHKIWVGLQLRNVWALRAGDLCNISRSWTKDLSEESQEVELKFKGLDLQRCKEIWEGTRDNLRVREYWKRLSKEEKNVSNKSTTRDPTLDSSSPQ